MSSKLLDPNRLAVIRTNAEEFGRVFAAAPQLLTNPSPSKERAELLGHIDALAAALNDATARATKAESRAAELVVEVLDILRDMRLPPLPLPAEYTPGGLVNYAYDYAKGQNKERQAINDYCRQKAYEYDPGGIGPDPTEVGQWDTRPAPPPSSPAAAPPPVAEWFSPLVFDSAADYDASVASAVERIESGEIQPREQDEIITHEDKCDNCGLFQNPRWCVSSACPPRGNDKCGAATTTGEGKGDA